MELVELKETTKDGVKFFKNNGLVSQDGKYVMFNYTTYSGIYDLGGGHAINMRKETLENLFSETQSKGITLCLRLSYYTLQHLCSIELDTLTGLMDKGLRVYGFSGIELGGKKVNSRPALLNDITRENSLNYLGQLGNEARKIRTKLFLGKRIQGIEALKQALDLGLFSFDDLFSTVPNLVGPQDIKNLQKIGILDALKDRFKVLISSDTTYKQFKELEKLNLIFDEKSEVYQNYMVKNTIARLG